MIRTMFQPVAGIAQQSQLDDITSKGQSWICAMAGGYSDDHVSGFTVIGVPHQDNAPGILVQKHPSAAHMQAFLQAAIQGRVEGLPPLQHITFVDPELVKSVLGEATIDYMNNAGEVLTAEIIPGKEDEPAHEHDAQSHTVPQVIFQTCDLAA